MTAYIIYDENKTKAPVLMHDAARPFVATAEYFSTRNGLVIKVLGRYSARSSAQARIRRAQNWRN